MQTTKPADAIRSAKPSTAPTTLSATDKEDARRALRAIHEALVRMSGAIETMGEKAQHNHDISPAGLFDVLRDSGQETFFVGAAAIDILEQILGVDIGMHDETGDPFQDAYRAVKREEFSAASVGAPTS